MQNRTRNRQLNLKFTDDEFEYIKTKKELTQAQNYTDFIMSLVSHSNIYNVDTTPLIETANEINKIGVNVNQIAKVINTTGNVYENEIRDLQNKIKRLEKIMADAYSCFIKAKNGEL